jgi:pyrroline-5-carboxylate reductase
LAFDLGIIGAGNMAEAIARGLIRSGQLSAAAMIVADPSAARRDLFQTQLKIQAVDDNAAVARQSSVLLLSVKPQTMPAALATIAAAADAKTLVISIAAGTSIRFIAAGLGGGIPWRIVRAMPNTPMLVGEGATAICAGENATEADLAEARRIFESAGIVIQTTEDKIDAVTAASGSGPAYFFYLAEQMIAAAIELGLPPDQARLLAAKTAVGAARMLMESPDSPAELRRKVTSPGGTTEAAIKHLDASHWPAAIVDAVKAAAARSRELSK